MTVRTQNLIRQIFEDKAVNGGDWTFPGFRAVATYRFGVWANDTRPEILRVVVMRFYLALYRWTRNHYGVELEHTVRIGRRLVLAHQGNIVIHRFAEIGDDCIIRQNVTLGAATAGDFTVQAPKLGSKVEIGCGVAIIGRVTIGDGVRIGPNAVVMTNVPARATVFAAPSRIIPSGKTGNQTYETSN